MLVLGFLLTAKSMRMGDNLISTLSSNRPTNVVKRKRCEGFQWNGIYHSFLLLNSGMLSEFALALFCKAVVLSTLFEMLRQVLEIIVVLRIFQTKEL